MNAFDWVAVVICGLCAFYGWRLGAVFSIVFLFGGFIGSWFSSNYYTIFAPFFDPHPQAIVYGYLCVFAVVLLALVGAGFIIHKFFKMLYLGVINRFIGLLLGVLLGIVLCAVLFIPLSTVNNEKIQQLLHDSLITKRIKHKTQKAIELFPPKKKKIFQIKIPPKLKKLKKDIKKITDKVSSRIKS